MKRCTKCGEEKALHEFYVDKRGAAPRPYSACKGCHSQLTRRWNERNPDARRAARLPNYFGITVEQYEAMLAEQQGVCAICGNAETAKDRWGKVKRLAVDHDKACCPARRSCGRCVRGLACFQCNTRLFAVEDPTWRPLADAYLEKAAAL